MIRRWSSLNILNLQQTNDFNKFFKIQKIELFKASVNLKRFHFKFTKFKRKIMARWKHRSFWIIYLNVLKNWTLDYQFNRQYARFQYYNKIFLHNTYLYYFNYIKQGIFKITQNIENILMSSISRKLYLYFYKNRINTRSLIFRNSNLIYGFLLDDTKLDASQQITYLVTTYETQLYPVLKPIIDIKGVFDFFSNNTLNLVTEIYKIIVYLFYMKIFLR